MNCFEYKDIYIGQKENFKFEITKEKMKQFLAISGDSNPLHNDIDYAKQKGYEDVVVYGLLTTSALSTLAGLYLPGKYSLIHSIEVSYVKPVFLNSSPLTVIGEVIDKDDRFSQITLKVSIYNNDNIKVLRGYMKIGIQEK